MKLTRNKPHTTDLGNALFLGIAVALPVIGLLLVIAALLQLPIWEIARDYSAFFLLGITGAIFANSTGAGGGVVFIPMFNQLGLSEAQAVATSFGIQCFGMTAGALTWAAHFRSPTIQKQRSWRGFARIIGICTCCSATGIWTAYGLELAAPSALNAMFGVFSLFLGLAILATVMLVSSDPQHSGLEKGDIPALILIAYGGGIVTAWLSVAVGEFVAFYLILRRYNVTMAVAAAVIISALTVWCAAPQHFLLNSNAYWQIILFAGPGAVIGGLIARPLVQLMGASRLKLFFGLWLVVIGLVEVPGLL